MFCINLIACRGSETEEAVVLAVSRTPGDGRGEEPEGACHDPADGEKQ
jgi:hypothetical protein